MVENKKIVKNKSFFAQFTDEQIFKHWYSAKNIFELAQKLGRDDYDYIQKKKNRAKK